MKRDLYISECAALNAACDVIARLSLPGARPATKRWSYRMPDKSRVEGWTASVILASGQIVPVEALA